MNLARELAEGLVHGTYAKFKVSFNEKRRSRKLAQPGRTIDLEAWFGGES